MPLVNPIASIAFASGSYTGNGTANRAIPHGMAGVPSLIFIFMRSNVSGYIYWQVSDDFIQYQVASFSGQHAVTAKTTTNFYVGNAANYAQSANFNASVYEWFAFIF